MSNYINNILKRMYHVFIMPRSMNEDTYRRELIFNILIVGFLVLTIFAFVVSLLRFIMGSYTAENISPVVLGIFVLILSILYFLARQKFRSAYVAIFLGLYLFIATFALYSFGYDLTQGLLIYMMVLIASSMLISPKASTFIGLIILVSLTNLRYLQSNGVVHRNRIHIDEPLNDANFIIYVAIFFVIFLISWLYGTEIQRSLDKVRKSEALLKDERDLLEVKVAERTKELRRAEAEKTIELYRFAEFGRLNLSLVHDLANPLMSLSMNFHELSKSYKDDELMTQIRSGLLSMENYVMSARDQVHNNSMNEYFNVESEIRKVLDTNNIKIKSLNVHLGVKFEKDVYLKGDYVKFNQLILNLVSNALDSLSSSNNNRKKTLKITSAKGNSTSVTICVRDNGMGIGDDNKSNIFKPFYTTKKHLKGTGIGLSIVRRVVDEFDGTIDVESNKSETVFKVILPANDGPS